MYTTEVQKVRPPARKFLKNHDLAENLRTFFIHFLMIKQFGDSVKEIILELLPNEHISVPFFIISHKSNKIQFDVQSRHFYF